MEKAEREGNEAKAWTDSEGLQEDSTENLDTSMMDTLKLSEAEKANIKQERLIDTNYKPLI